MDYVNLLQQAAHVAKLVNDLRKTAQAASAALSKTQIEELRAELDKIHPVTLEMGKDLDAALERAKNTD